MWRVRQDCVCGRRDGWIWKKIQVEYGRRQERVWLSLEREMGYVKTSVEGECLSVYDGGDRHGLGLCGSVRMYVERMVCMWGLLSL